MLDMRSLFTRLGNSGDTIVEVLIATAVISLVLAGAYASSNRNALTTQDTQEKGQAQQLVQKQIEIMRIVMHAHPATNPIGGCLSLTTPYKLTGADCSFDRYGNSNCTDDPCFVVNVTSAVASPGLVYPSYNVRVKWDSLKADKSSVSMNYGPTR